MWIQVHPLWIQGLKRLVLWTQNLTLLEDQGLWIQALFFIVPALRLRQVVSKQDLSSSFKFSKMSKGKYHSLPLSTSGIHYNHDMHEALLKNDFPEVSCHLNIEEFFQWLFEVERFFEYRDISYKKKVKFVAHKLKKSAWDWWDQLQTMRTRLRKDPIESWEKMKKYLKRQFLPPHYQELLYEKYKNFKQLGNSVSEFTNEFYRLRSYLDLNEPEAYIISRYMMGLRWEIRERLSSLSFYYLSDLVSAAKGIEKQMEREKTKKGRPQTLHHTTIEDVRYPVVSATQKIFFNCLQSNAKCFNSFIKGV